MVSRSVAHPQTADPHTRAEISRCGLTQLGRPKTLHRPLNSRVGTLLQLDDETAASDFFGAFQQLLGGKT
jgi:hypothetical protein